VVLTTQRLLVIRDDFTKQKVEDFPLAQIASVAWSSGTLGGTDRCVGSEQGHNP
jgi:Bacterial PH domain